MVIVPAESGLPQFGGTTTMVGGGWAEKNWVCKLTGRCLLVTNGHRPAVLLVASVLLIPGSATIGDTATCAPRLLLPFLPSIEL